ncbi:MAG: type II toxin-antitoxin system Phd/YefM family antitoxin [Spirochaetes bacterium]|nr:MAG: type II toxin-antitoxin system Phd/YefM family antitoxin [Spirochaetota bacterium]
MKRMNVSEVRRLLPIILNEIQKTGESVIVSRYGRPVARITPYRSKGSKEERYSLRSLPVRISEDFDEPLEDIWEALKH